jgi:hypothetical protein
VKIYTSQTSVSKRFWGKVDKRGPIPSHVPSIGNCFLWTAYRNPLGYGTIMIDKSPQYAHRVSWWLAHGTFPDGCVLHKCDNPSCVRPCHLFIGTIADNIRDMTLKRRVAHSEKHGHAKLSNEEALVMIRRKRLGESTRFLAREYGISQMAVSRAGRKTWLDVSKGETVQ